MTGSGYVGIARVLLLVPACWPVEGLLANIRRVCSPAQQPHELFSHQTCAYLARVVHLAQRELHVAGGGAARLALPLLLLRRPVCLRELGDRIDRRHLLTACLLLSGLLNIAFGVAGVCCVRDLAFYAAIWALYGAVSSLTWPCSVGIMGQWFGHSHRGAVFGVWSANASARNIMGSAIAAAVLGRTPSAENCSSTSARSLALPSRAAPQTSSAHERPCSWPCWCSPLVCWR